MIQSPTIDNRRDKLRASLLVKKDHLKSHEFEYANGIIDGGNEDEIELLEQNLNDSQLFFEHTPPKESNSERQSLERAMGSVRRLQEVNQRKSCNTRAQLWKKASNKVITANRIASLGKSGPRSPGKNASEEKMSFRSSMKESMGQSLRAAILEDEPFSQSEDTDDSYSHSDYSTIDEKKSDEEEMEYPQHFGPGTMIRKASVNLYRGEGFEVGEEELLSSYKPQYDPWHMSEKSDWEGHTYDFNILGTSPDDPLAQPHVLSPPLMYTLESYLPEAKRGESFWLKYSLVRDGATRSSFLQNVRGSEHTLLAMETLDGEVFGCFVSSTWSLQPNYYGSGECFVWRMKTSRATLAESVLEQAKRETDIDVFPYTFENRFVQLCQHDKIGIGGGTTTAPREVTGGVTLEPSEFGFSLLFDGDYLLNATSSACLTFSSPSLSKLHSDGSKFELVNLEAWALTPCHTLVDAQMMECKRTFLKRNMTV